VAHGEPREGVQRRSFGIEDELWEAAIAKAKAEGRALAEVIREFLREYVKTPVPR
jgi:hypothetical protein